MAQRYKLEQRNPPGARTVFAIRCSITDMIVGGNFDREKAAKTLAEMEQRWREVCKASDKDEV